MADDPILSLTDDTFDQRVLRSEGTLLVEFSTQWCGMCRVQAATVLSLAAVWSPRVTFARVDADAARAVSQRYDIRCLPTMLLFSRGQLIRTLCGVHSRPKLQAILADVAQP